MGRTASAAALAALVIACACGSGSGSGGAVLPGPGTEGEESFTGNLGVVAHHPADGAVQVPLDTQIRVEFDWPVVSGCTRQEGTGLFVAASGAAVPGTYAFDNGGRALLFTPQAPLLEQTDYAFRVSPLTCDTAWRILDREVAFGFRTLDARPPSVASASVGAGQSGVSRTAPLAVDFDEGVLASSASGASVVLRDVFGTSCRAGIAVAGARVTVAPAADLAGDRDYVLEVHGGVAGIQDRAGNPLVRDWSVAFRTATDTAAPVLQSLWPPTGAVVSPAVEPRIAFDESIDPGSVEPSSITLADQYGALIPFHVVPSADLRALRLVPSALLTPGRHYTLSLAMGPGGVTDVSGNPLAQAHATDFTAGSDATPPQVALTEPAPSAARVSLNVAPQVQFSEPLDADSIAPAVSLFDGIAAVPCTVALEAGGTALRVTPTGLLAPGRGHVLTVRGGADGVRDAAGNPLAADATLAFHSADDPTLPGVLLAPHDGHASVPRSAHASAVFDAPVDPTTVGPTTVFVQASSGPVPGTLEVARSDRVVRFTPDFPWTPGAWYTLVVAGGPQGVREISGNWLAADRTSQFRAAADVDTQAPVVRVTLNGIDAARNAALSVPPYGFDIDVEALDQVHLTLDMASAEVSIGGSGAVPGVEPIFAAALIDGSSLRYRIPASWALAEGDYTLTATVRDLSGNLGTSTPLAFRVREPDPGALPFERTQVFWVRFDLDRDGNGRGDLEDDLLRLGLMSAGDPSGTNQRMLSVLRDGIVARAHDLLFRAPNGDYLGSDSVALRVTGDQPHGLVHSQIACAGLDPEGDPRRGYGDPSTGVLGRAFFDYRNGDIGDHNTASSPGLGVFPAEVFLFEARIHASIYPAFTSTFARRFLNLCPDMGGTPAGSHPLDPIVLAPGFDWTNASSAERARFSAVFDAADDWATAIGVILAHEIGHAVGLVAEGPNPHGLHGDASLHNAFSGATDIMAPALGYDAIVSLAYGYRDLNIGYLRQRIVMK